MTRRGWTRPVLERCGSRPGDSTPIVSAFCLRARSELAAPLLAGGLESLTVGGLDTAEAVGLVNEFAGSPGRGVGGAARSPSAGGGHPLWLREAARELSPEQMAGAAPLTDRFRAPASVQAAFARRALRLSPRRPAMRSWC